MDEESYNAEDMTDEELDALTSPESEKLGAQDEAQNLTMSKSTSAKKNPKLQTPPNAAKVKKLKEENRKLAEKIKTMQERIEENEKEIRQLENDDLISMFRNSGMVLDDLVALMQQS